MCRSWVFGLCGPWIGSPIKTTLPNGTQLYHTSEAQDINNLRISQHTPTVVEEILIGLRSFGLQWGSNGGKYGEIIWTILVFSLGFTVLVWVLSALYYSEMAN